MKHLFLLFLLISNIQLLFSQYYPGEPICPYVSISTNKDSNNVEYWSTSNHWCKYPTPEMQLVISDGEIIIDTNVVCWRLIINPGAKLVLGYGYTLTVTENFTIQCYKDEIGMFIDNSINGLKVYGEMKYQCDDIVYEDTTYQCDDDFVTHVNTNVEQKNLNINDIDLMYNLLGQPIRNIQSYHGLCIIMTNNKRKIIYKK